MYRVIAYHGKGKDQELEHDLRLLWKSLCDFAKCRKLQHIYCFQAVRDGEEVNLLLVVQYHDNVAAKLALPTRLARQASQTHSHMDYWFYVRDNRYETENKKRRVS